MMAASENTTKTSGVVISHKNRRTADSVLVHPVVRFETESGEIVEFESPTGSNAPPKVGADIEVVYDPANPHDAHVPLTSVSRFGLAPFYVAGGFILIVGGLMLLMVLAVAVLVLLVAISG